MKRTKPFICVMSAFDIKKIMEKLKPEQKERGKTATTLIKFHISHCDRDMITPEYY